MNVPMYRSIHNIKKESKGIMDINNGKYMCKIERIDIPQPFAFASSKKTMVDVIDATLSEPMLLPKHFIRVQHIDIKNYG
jgi:hypothetical protein